MLVYVGVRVTRSVGLCVWEYVCSTMYACLHECVGEYVLL